MQRFFLLSGLSAALAIVVYQTIPSRSAPRTQDKPAAKQHQEKTEARPAVDHSADEDAIRANVAAFTKAYNAHDAKAIAALFTPNGQVVDEEGNASEGRD